MSAEAQNPARRKEWFEVVENTTPYLFRVVTQDGYGTGFFLVKSNNGLLSGVATAYHVIARAFEWGFPIRLEHAASKKTVMLYPNNRHIEYDVTLDTAIIVLEKGDIPWPENELKLVEEKKNLKVGCDLGWLGFPAISANELCFFSGHISSWNEKEHRYLVDGVVINGVSGGPVLRNRANGDVRLAGIISAYIPNNSTGKSMPGLSVVRDVSSFFSTIKKLKSLPPPQENPPPVATAPLVEPKPPGEVVSEEKQPK
jgi:hypothetical protein